VLVIEEEGTLPFITKIPEKIKNKRKEMYN
jgi:hypothetical protein